MRHAWNEWGVEPANRDVLVVTAVRLLLDM